ncbi:hypothetical protein DMB95_08675 [Campylobacter sp. MIT 12-8780]|uniref:hypothetical protein n=1 Tax=unclassified Campylobacter TaxID=2593542 RepID=UPI00115EE96B|nr:MULTISPECIES: hypothetical protein [unclassified Campylobacter]NDJ27974.1 hypothetical protein [Campylobacter sp. MIT 19-121]TQR40095.1 hypothetical protein DMB95_08675 [Campylobacter sp. MIT 12-8780]
MSLTNLSHLDITSRAVEILKPGSIKSNNVIQINADRIKHEYSQAKSYSNISDSAYTMTIRSVLNFTQDILSRYQDDEAKYERLSEKLELFKESLDEKSHTFQSSTIVSTHRASLDKSYIDKPIKELVQADLKALLQAINEKNPNTILEKEMNLKSSLIQLSGQGQFIENFAGGFFTEVWHELSQSEKQQYFEYMDIIKSYHYNKAKNLTTEQGDTFSWDIVGGKFQFELISKDNENLSDQIRLASDKKVFSSLYAIFELREKAYMSEKNDTNSSNDDKNEKKLTSNSSNSSLLQRVLQELA